MPGRGRSPAPAVVVSVGGSVLRSGKGDARFLVQLADLLVRLGRSRRLVVTTGGGRTAREYIHLGSAVGLTRDEQDELGIDVTRLHARLLARRMKVLTADRLPTSVRGAVAAARRGAPVVLGGTKPGHTTDAVAAWIAVRLGASRLVNATDVDGLYDADPKTHRNARRLPRLGWGELLRLLRRTTSGGPGQNFPFDRLGAEALARASIPLVIVGGRDLANLRRAIEGKAFQGTLVGGAGGGSV